MDNHASNPAGRLLLYFGHLWTSTETDSTQPHAAVYFGLPAGYSAQYLSAVSTLMTLPDEVEALVARLEDPPLTAEKLISPLAAVRTVLEGDPLGSNPIAWVKQTVNSTIMSELDSTSQILNRYITRGTPIDEDTLASIKKLAHEIIEQAQQDDSIDEATRIAFIRYATRITEAADLYKVTGPQPLIDELDRFHYERNRLTSEPGPSLWEKTRELTVVLVTAVELFLMPMNAANAIEYYGEHFTQQQIIEAPAEHDPNIIDADVIEDDDGEAA